MLHQILIFQNKSLCVIEYSRFIFQEDFFMYIKRALKYGIFTNIEEKRAKGLCPIPFFPNQLRIFMRSNYNYTPF